VAMTGSGGRRLDCDASGASGGSGLFLFLFWPLVCRRICTTNRIIFARIVTLDNERESNTAHAIQ
jgi:hypothetical protein